MSATTSLRFTLCAWCQKEGRETWLNERGQIVKVPAWAKPATGEISHGICSQHLLEVKSDFSISAEGKPI